MALPILVAGIVGGLVSAAGSLVGRVLLAMGIGFVAYQGIDVALTGIKAVVVGNITALPPQVVQVVRLLKVDVAINILFSAIAARFVLQGLTGGTIKKMVTK